MVFAVWSSIYETGHGEIDRQHQRLFQMVNDLHEAMVSGHGREAMEPVLRALASYTIEHFAAEESLMREAGYEGLAAHKAQHDDLAGQVNELMERYSKGYLTLPSTLSRFLTDWLKHHIREEDLAFIDWLRERQS